MKTLHKIVKLLSPTLLLLFLGALPAMAQDNQHSELQAFPNAEKGMQRFVIVLPNKTREDSERFKVELIPGKSMKTDGINSYRLGMEINAKPLVGWGYTYYEISGGLDAMTSLVGVPEGTKEITRYVFGKSLTIDYNSRLPIVVYAPKGYELKYRLWRTENELNTAKIN